MKAKILFPFRQGDDNRKAFAFTVEMARRSNKDMLVLTSMGPFNNYLPGPYVNENEVLSWKNEIYCNLLEMKGYYHGRFNQWKAFDDVNIQVRVAEGDLNGAICSYICDETDLVIVLQQKFFSGNGLHEEIQAGASSCNVTFFLLPGDFEFSEPYPNQIGPVFYKQKRVLFMKLLQATKIFNLPEDKDEFRDELILQQAV